MTHPFDSQPRTANQQFDFKHNTEADDAISAFIANQTLGLEIGDDEILIFSHADGDFDATNLGFEDIAVTWEHGSYRVQASTDLDLYHLSDDFDWVDEHKEKIVEAIGDLYYGIVVNAKETYVTYFRFDVSDEAALVCSVEDTITLIRRNDDAMRFSDDVCGDQLWGKIREKLNDTYGLRVPLS